MAQNSPSEPVLPEGVCGRFQEIMERKLLAEPVSDADRALLESHPKQCRDCAGLALLLDEMAVIPPLDPDDRAEIARNVSQILTRRRRLGRRNLALVVGGLATAAVVALIVTVVFWAGRGPSSPPVGLVLHEGSLAVDGRRSPLSSKVRVPVGRRLVAGRSGALLHLGRRARIRMLARSEATIIRAGPARFVLGMRRGAVLFQVRRAAGTTVAVLTPHCRVSVKGTTFLVTVAHGQTTVEVTTGAVQVAVGAGSSSKPVTVPAGCSFSTRDGRLSPLSSPRFRQIGVLLSGSRNADNGNNALPEAGVPTIRSVRDAGVPAGRPAADRGNHTPGGPSQRGLPPAVSLHSGRKASAARVGATARAGATAGPAMRPPTAEQFLKRARRCRLQGDWRCAAGEYRTLLGRLPAHPAAITALVSLAQIELGHLKQPVRAIGHFRQYLRRRPRGALAAEALYGQARALAALGKKRQELAALKRFLRRFPSSVHAPRARARMAKLKSDAKATSR